VDKFTPGKWKLSGHKGLYGLPDICREDGDCLLMADSCGGTISTEEMSANLQLAAAAPELREALRAIVPFIAEDFSDETSQGESCCSDGYRNAFRLIEAAISKATAGEATDGN
jgi:hypothetical protein